jgi:hypothetical protein
MNIRYFEKRGTWWLDFRDAAGARRRVPSGCLTLADAKKAAPAILARELPADRDKASKTGAILAGFNVPFTQISPISDIPVITFKEAYLKAMKVREKWVQAKDKDGLETKYEQVTAYWGADTPLAHATRDAVLEWRSKMMQTEGKRAGTKMHPSTINHRLSFVQCLLEVANLPPHGVKHLSTKGNERKRRVRQEELDAVIDWLHTARTHRKVPYKGAAAFAEDRRAHV